MENCNILAVPGCATDSTTCNDTKYEIFVAVATAISQIISMIAFPGAGVIAKFIELGLQIIDLCKNVYDFLKKRIEVIQAWLDKSTPAEQINPILIKRAAAILANKYKENNPYPENDSLQKWINAILKRLKEKRTRLEDPNGLFKLISTKLKQGKDAFFTKLA